MYLFSLILTSFVLNRVLGALTPSGSLPIDCGGQQIFTCTVAGTAGWTITGLMGITASGGTAGGTAVASARFTTTDTGLSTTSTITITGFNISDNGGVVQCVDIGSSVPSVEGMATIAVVSTSLASATAVMSNVDQCSATLTWSEPSDSSANTSVSCTPSSPQCSTCTSSGCTIGGLTHSTSYTFSVTRSRSGCGDRTAMSSAVMSEGLPQCGAVGVVIGNDSCPSFTFTLQGSVLPSTVVVSYQLVGDPSSEGSLNCDYPVDPRMCRLAVPEGTYTVRLTPQNSCGSPPSTCSSFTEIVLSNCTVTVQTSPGCPLCWLLLLLLPLLILVGYSISVAVVWHLYYKDYNYCQVYWCCCFCKRHEGDGKIRTSSTEPMKTSPPPPRPPAPVAAPLGEYADPKDVRKRKEENKIQYADLEFTKQSGGGRGTIHQKEEPVTYTAIQHA